MEKKDNIQDLTTYRFFETTGDVGIYVYGGNIEDIFINAGKALFSLITKSKREGEEEKEIELESDSIERLFINWLNELIFLFDSYGYIATSIDVKIEGDMPYRLFAKVLYYTFDIHRDEQGLLIKAATYHNFYLKKTDDGYEAKVLFDI